MARIAMNLLLVAALLVMSSLIVSAISAADVPDPTCAGGWNIHGTFVPREQGGCCHGTDCCQYAAFSDNPLCGAVPAPTCSGTECCKYEKYKNTPLCTVSVTPAPGEESCTGTECCQYEKYKNTALCVVSPNASDEEECDPVPPDCPIGGGPGGNAPMLLDPAIASGSKCRGACGPDCPKTCTSATFKPLCIADKKGKCFYLCTYSNVLSCGTHDGCQTHDDCYDACAAEGENRMCYLGGFCHCGCDLGCYFKYGLSNCWDWMNGKGPTQGNALYSSPPLRSEPMKSCP